MPNHARALLIGLAIGAAASAPSVWAQTTGTTAPAIGAPVPPIDANTPVEPLVPGTDTGAPAPVATPAPPAVDTTAPAAVSAPAAESGTQAVESGAKKTGEGLSETARGIGSTVVEGTKAAGNTIAGAASVTGRSIGDAGKAVGRGAKSAWEVTRDGVLEFADSVVNFVSRPF